MSGEIVRAVTPDDLELTGFLKHSDVGGEKPAVIHIHGMYENFYLPLFIEPLYKKVSDQGNPFISANTRAHDYLIFCRRWENEQYSWSQEGGCHEIFSDSIYDIQGWISYAKDNISSNVILSGHSHGSLKSTYYALNRSTENIKGLCLISPSDDIGLQKQNLGDRYDEALDKAEEMISDGRGDEFMPQWVYGNPMTANMYYDMFSEDSDLGIFRFDNPNEGFSKLGQLDIPILTIFAEEDKATSTVTSSKAIELIDDNLPDSTKFRGEIIDSTNHNYDGKKDELAEIVSSWISEIN